MKNQAKPYQSKDALSCYNRIHEYRKKFIPDAESNELELRCAIVRAVKMYLDSNCKYPTPPIAEDDSRPTLQDFFRLEEWFYFVATNKAEPTKVSAKNGKKKFTATEKLLGILARDARNPKMSLAAIAREAGVSRTYAYECEKFMATYRLVKPERRKGKKYRFDDNRDS